MNYKSLLLIIFLFLLGCEQNNLSNKVVNQEIMLKYKNSGFALVYDSALKKEKKISKKLTINLFLFFTKI